MTTDPALRQLRIHLVRLHEERETLKRVLQLLASKQLRIEPDTDASDEMQAYLDRASKFLEKSSFRGIDTDVTLRAAYGAEVLVNDGEWASVGEALAKSRRQLARAVERVVDADRARTADRPIINVFSGGQVTNNSINISGGEFHDVNIAQGEQITQSLKHVESSGVDDQIKSTMAEISEELKKLLPQMKPEDAEKATQSYDRLAKAASEDKPDRKWYEVSAGGLLEAAKAVAAAGEPLIGLLGKLFGLAG